MGVHTRKSQRAGRFLLSDEKIKEFTEAKITSDSYERDPHYFKGIVEYIINNSHITKLSKAANDLSMYGLVYKLKLKDGISSPLVNLKLDHTKPLSANFYRNKSFKPVRTFLLKLSFLSLLEETEISRDGKTSVLMKDFAKEAKIQNECYDKTYELGESVVPGCISPAYYDLFTQHNVTNPIFSKLLEPAVDDDDYLGSLAANARDANVLQFGLILMEFAEGFRTLDSIIRDKTVSEENKTHATMLAKTAHLILYNKGVVQGDGHNQNVMVNLDYTGFMADVPGKALVIDFGRALKVKDMNLDIGADKYEEVLKFVSSVSSGGHDRRPQYEWLRIAKPLENKYLSMLLEYKNERLDIVTHYIKDAIPKAQQKDELFAAFLENPNIAGFNRLRWRNLQDPVLQNAKRAKTAKNAGPLVASKGVRPAVAAKGVRPAVAAKGTRPVAAAKAVGPLVTPPMRGKQARNGI